MEPVQLDTTTDMALVWAAFRSGADPAVREQVIEFYLPFARIMAAKLYAKRTYIELEFSDYMQYASIGLMEAIDRFDPDRGVRFETFAAPRINGAILNGIETLSEKQVQVSARQRILSARVKSLKDASPELADSNAVFCYLAELAVGLAIGFALEDSGIYQTEESSYPDNTYHRVELKQLRKRIGELVEQLPDNERRVVKYHYLQQVPFDEIATLLGVTKGRVSQIHKNALKRMEQIIRSLGEIDLRC